MHRASNPAMPRSTHATGPALVPATMRAGHREPMSPSLIPPWSVLVLYRDFCPVIHRNPGLPVHDLAKGLPRDFSTTVLADYEIKQTAQFAFGDSMPSRRRTSWGTALVCLRRAAGGVTAPARPNRIRRDG